MSWLVRPLPQSCSCTSGHGACISQAGGGGDCMASYIQWSRIASSVFPCNYCYDLAWEWHKGIPQDHCCVLLMQGSANVAYTQAATSCTFITIFALSTDLRPDHHRKSYISQTWSSPYDNLRKYFMALGFPCVCLSHIQFGWCRSWVCRVMACI